jgi:transcriptional regulator with XRE-family HTH domain
LKKKTSCGSSGATRGGELGRVFSENLRKLRGDQSQAEFASRLGIPHQQTYQRYESGLVPSGEILHRMSKLLAVSIDQLFEPGGVDGMAPIFVVDTFIRENFRAKPLHELTFDEVQQCLTYALELLAKSAMPIRSIYASIFIALNRELQKRMENPPPDVRAKMEQWYKEQGLKLPKK